MSKIPRLTILFTTCCALILATSVAPAASKQESQKQEQALLAVIGSDASQKEKADACRELARIAGRAAVKPLAALLKDKELSHMARYAMETIPDSSVDAAFRDALQVLQGRELAGVVHSIGVRRDSKAVPAISKLLSSRDPDVSTAAAWALGRIGNAKATEALMEARLASTNLQQAAIAEGLFRCAESATSRKDPKAAMRIYERLLSTEWPAQVRAGAFAAAVRAEPKRESNVLLQNGLSSPDPVLFAAAIRAIQTTPTHDSTSMACEILPTLADERQILLVQALATLPSAESLKALSAAAKAGSKDVRIAAIRGLGFESAASPKLLGSLVLDSDPDIAETARESLAAIAGTETDELVLGLVRGSDPKARSVGLDLLSRRRMIAAVPELVTMAAQENDLRPVVVRRIGELGGASETQTLLGLLRTAHNAPDREAAQAALEELGKRAQNQERFVSEIAAQFAAAQPEEKAALLRVAASTENPAALKLVRDSMQGQPQNVRAAAMRIMGTWSGIEAAPYLLEVASQPEASAERALALQGYLRSSANTDIPPQQRLEMCKKAERIARSSEDKKLLLSALGGIPLQGSLNAITTHLSDASLKAEAVTAGLNVSDKLLAAKNVEANAPKLAEALEKLVSATDDPRLRKRAQSLLESARKKGGQSGTGS